VIPAFNEEKTVGGIIERALVYVDKVVVVNDGSWDDTSSISVDKGAVVLSHLLNIGTGGAVMTGIKYVAKHYPHADIIVLDADGQHFPEDIPSFLIRDAKVVIGARLGNRDGLSFYKKFLNTIASKICGLFAGIEVLDSESGFRLYRVEAVKNISFLSYEYGWASENIIRLARKGLSILFIPIKTVWGISPRSGQSRRGFIYGVKALIDLVKNL